MAESVCSRATFEAVKDGGRLAFGQSNSATFLRPITQGHLNASARARHRGRTSWVWQVEVTDDEGRLCALVQVVVAVREAPGGRD
jgi:1,4-dihydroxy-2-naphthoyl-CoA hydrolase